MSDSDLHRFDDLLSRYLDATLDAAQEQDLLGYLEDEALAARFHEAAQFNAEIAGIVAGSMPDQVMAELVVSDLRVQAQPAPPKRSGTPRLVRPGPSVARPVRKHTGLVALVALLVALLIAGGAFYYAERTPAGAPVAIAEVTGEAFWIVGNEKIALTGHQEMHGPGTLKTVGQKSRATLTLKDGTWVELKGNTSLVTDETPGKRKLFLEQGVLRSEITKQPANAPMVFTTPGATITVHGTELAIISNPRETLLVVIRGEVALRRSPAEPEIIVETGHYGRVETSGKYVAWPISRLQPDQREEAFAK